MPLRSLSKRLAPTLTAYLLLVSLGLPLQLIYCACVGEQWVGLPTAEHECHHAAAKEAHEHKSRTCCHLLEESETPLAQDRHDCGDSEILLAQLDVDFLWEPDQVSWYGEDPAPLTVIFHDWPVKPALAKATPIRGPTPPPLPSGRDALVAYQTFLL